MAKDKENILEPCRAILSYDQENELEENMDQRIQGYQAFLYLSINKISNMVYIYCQKFPKIMHFLEEVA